MLFDFDHVPFSRFGRALTLSQMRTPESDGLRAVYLRSVRGGDERASLGRFCRLTVRDAQGEEREVTWTLTPSRLAGTIAGGGWIAFAIGEGERLHLEGGNCTLAFALEGSRYDYAVTLPDGRPCVVSARENIKFIPYATKGDLAVTGDWQTDHSEDVVVSFSGKRFEGVIDGFLAAPPPVPVETFAMAEADAAAAFGGWLDRCPPGPEDQAEARRLAAYLLWANTVSPHGRLTRPAIYMSKNAMINIWAWDNAFSALGVAGIDPQLAFEQFAAIFDHQDASGLLPDYVNDKDVAFSFTKPPVHGWALRLIMDAHPDFLTAERRVYLAEAVGRQVSYWLTHARPDATVLPAYVHGNDSGWDNATFFAAGGPVETPDLATFLILAAEQLAALSQAEADRERWTGIADALYALLIERLWNGKTFVARRPQGEVDTGGDSLIQFMPLLLGKRLDPVIAETLLARLDAHGFITRWGPATESPDSPLYEDDGYWRGPIWAPTTYLLWDGLRRQGADERAAEVAMRFSALANRSGMAENFDALTGRGLRDRAFAWTSAVYLLLASTLVSPLPESRR
jgi:glycogen debranching enzyme